MPRMYEPLAGKNGWTDWQKPVMRGYRLGCCDCGLVHDFDFRVVWIRKRHRDAGKEVDVLPSRYYQVEFRVRRNQRSTGQIRRHMGKRK